MDVLEKLGWNNVLTLVIGTLVGAYLLLRGRQIPHEYLIKSTEEWERFALDKDKLLASLRTDLETVNQSMARLTRRMDDKERAYDRLMRESYDCRQYLAVLKAELERHGLPVPVWANGDGWR